MKKEFMKGAGLKISGRDKAMRDTPMEMCTMVNFTSTKRMGEVSTIGKMERSMMVSGSMERRKVMGYGLVLRETAT